MTFLGIFFGFSRIADFNGYARTMWLKPDGYETCPVSCLKATGIERIKLSQGTGPLAHELINATNYPTAELLATHPGL
jgi:hypothetical protein